MTDTRTAHSMIQLPPAALAALHRALAAERSPAEAGAAARQLGFETGESFLASLQQWLDEQQPGDNVADLPAERFWAGLSDFFASLGWGSLRFRRDNAAVATLTSDRWAEADPGSGARQPTCHFTTGLLADLLGRVAGDDLAVLEVECRSRGDQACRFALGNADALERVHASLQRGTAFDDAAAALA